MDWIKSLYPYSSPTAFYWLSLTNQHHIVASNEFVQASCHKYRYFHFCLDILDLSLLSLKKQWHLQVGFLLQTANITDCVVIAIGILKSTWQACSYLAPFQIESYILRLYQVNYIKRSNTIQNRIQEFLQWIFLQVTRAMWLSSEILIFRFLVWLNRLGDDLVNGSSPCRPHQFLV